MVELALDGGNHVTALVRSSAKLGELARRVDVVEGDVLDAAAVEKTIAGSDAVLSALGHAEGSPKDLETIAMGNIVASMRKNGVKRLVVLANTVVSDSADQPTMGQAFSRWLLKIFRREIYDDSLGKARVIQSSDLEWTMVRTSLLTNAPPTGRYSVGRMGSGAGLRISRGDMAEYMLKCAIEGKSIRECPYVSN
jgi:putative NADH-flavin reductase